MQIITILRDQSPRPGTDAEKKWKLVKKHDGKSVDQYREAATKAKLPKSRIGLSWLVRKEYVALKEVPDPKPEKAD